MQCASCLVSGDLFPKVFATRTQWYLPNSLTDVFALLEKYKTAGVMVVAGGTGKGVFKDQPSVQAYVDIQGVHDLFSVKVHSNAITLGSAVTLSGMISALEKHQQTGLMAQKLNKLAIHIRKVASRPVRNVGTWAGNLMLTHDHDNFPSDLHTILTALELL